VGTVIGVVAGSTNFFTAGLVPPYSAPLLSGPAFSTPDSKVALFPDPQNVFMVVAEVARDNTAAAFPLTITGQSSKGKVSNTFLIPILPAAP
jgi:hypothetical protein